MIEDQVPDAALEADIATLAQKGAGKSYANRGLVERLLQRGRRTIILDPMNIWWGLKTRADGSPGFPVVVIGGPNADVDLDPDQGEALAAFLAAADVSAVLDVSELRRGQLLRFSGDFLAALYRLNREALWLVLEEADVFAPQNPMGDATMLLHQVDQIARRGRNRGFRLWSITQRPAKLHKDVLSMASTLIMMRIRSPQDRAAAADWIKGNADAGETARIVGELAALPVGEGWVYSPDVDLLARIKFPPIITLDTGKTPQHGEARQLVGQLASADAAVAALRAHLAPAPSEDPADAAPKGKGLSTAAVARETARAHAEGRIEGNREGYARGVATAAQLVGVEIRKVLELVDQLQSEAVPMALASGEAAPAAPEKVAQDLARVSSPPKPPPAKATKSAGRGMAATLEWAARSGPGRNLTWSEIAVIAGVSDRSGPFFAAKRELLAREAIIDGQVVNLVRAAAPPLDPVSAADVLEVWCGKLPSMAGRILRHLFVIGSQTKADVAAVLQVSDKSGPWFGAWKKLRENHLTEETDGGQMQLARILRDLKEAAR